MPLSPGSRVGPYQITATLGEGGMGEVYRAHDPRLGRDVALKVLPAEMASDPARLERFTREARAIAALNHPHIVTIYSTEEVDGIRFLTMELVEGQPLDVLIPPAGLTLGRFLDLALPLADALTAAHQKQITHRDLKPANVMVAADGRIKVLDFGLARVGGPLPDQTSEATRAMLTSEGTIVGTIPYMSPEQIEGKTIDHRTDLFSLGVIFHEMLTGSRPFKGESSPQLMASILRDVPRSASEIRTEVPEALSRLIHRCLEKRPDDRLQTARDIYNELKHLQKQRESSASRPTFDSASSGGGRAARPSDPATPSSRERVSDTGVLAIAVRLFTARGGDSATELAEGLSDDVTTGLSRFSYLRVVPRTAVESTPAPVRYVLEGQVRRAASTVRVSARLIDTMLGAQLWAENYDRPADTDVFQIQDDIASRIVATVADASGVMLRSMVATLRQRPIAAHSVSDLVIRFHGYLEHFDPAEHAQLRDGLTAALQNEPNHADGWACLSSLIEHEALHGLNRKADSVQRTRESAERSIAANPVCQEGWRAMASAAFYARDAAAVRIAAERAIAINPLNTATVAVCGLFVFYSGARDRGLEVVRQAMQPNPHYPGWLHFPFFTYHYNREEYQEALRHTKPINMPRFPKWHLTVAAAAGRLGLRDEARGALAALRRLDPAAGSDESVRTAFASWIWTDDEMEHFVEGVRRARALQ
jgi:serine/threonine protein kinase